jgi:hypothetical protein
VLRYFYRINGDLNNNSINFETLNAVLLRIHMAVMYRDSDQWGELNADTDSKDWAGYICIFFGIRYELTKH